MYLWAQPGSLEAPGELSTHLYPCQFLKVSTPVHFCSDVLPRTDLPMKTQKKKKKRGKKKKLVWPGCGGA